MSTVYWGTQNPGLLIVLLDQSEEMSNDYQDGMTKAEFATKSVNKIIQSVIDMNFCYSKPKDKCFIAIVGYGAEASLLKYGLISDFSKDPIATITETTKMSDGAGGIIEVPIRRPIWINPKSTGSRNLENALIIAGAIIDEYINMPNQAYYEQPAPMIINIMGGLPYVYNSCNERVSTENDVIVAAKNVTDRFTNDGYAYVYNTLLDNSVKTLSFPNNTAELSNESVSEFVFNISSNVSPFKFFLYDVNRSVKGCAFNMGAELFIRGIYWGTSAKTTWQIAAYDNCYKETSDIGSFLYSISSSELFEIRELRGGVADKMPNGNTIRYVGSFSVVFPYTTSAGNKCALRCMHTQISNLKHRYNVLSKKLESLKLPYLVSLEFIEFGVIIPDGIAPIIKMEWVDGSDLKQYVTDNLSNKVALKTLLTNFIKMVESMHYHNISHGDLQCSNIIVTTDGGIKLVDYDSMYVDELSEYDSNVRGLSCYYYPFRHQTSCFSAKMDYFAELIIYIALKVAIEAPDLWREYCANNYNDNLFFNEADFSNITQSTAYINISSISDELNKLTLTLKEFCETDNIENLRPLEHVISDIKLSSVHSSSPNKYGIYKSIQDAKNKSVTKENAFDYSDMFSSMKESMNNNKSN